MAISTAKASICSARWAIACLVAFAGFGLQVASASAASSEFDGASADGQIVVFSSRAQLVPGDTDHETDLYARSYDTAVGEYVTRELSIGPYGGNDARSATYDGMSRDGNEVFFSTRERLVAGDSDHAEDIYVRILSENRTLLVSQGAGPSQGGENCSAHNCGAHEIDAIFVPGGVPATGGRVFFSTTEALTAADTDGSADIYVRNIAAATTELVSAGEAGCVAAGCGDGETAATFLGADGAGGEAYFTTTESLSSEDADSEADIYQRDLASGTTSLVSVAGTCPPPGTNCAPSFGGVSADGSHVFFETRERLTTDDTDDFQDVYGLSGGHLTLVSTGPDGGNGSFAATYAGATADGGQAYFATREPIDPAADTDEAQDVYARSGATTTLVSVGAEGRGNDELPAEFELASPDGSAVVFSTVEQLVPGDTDQVRDVYRRSGGVTTLVSTGPEAPGGELDATFAGASDDGSDIYFVTEEKVTPLDHDSSPDLYRYSPTGTELISVGPVGGNGAFEVVPQANSSDGTYAFFTTDERLTAEDDFTGERDVYGHGPSGTYMVSVANNPNLVLGPEPPALERTDPASPGASTTPTIIGQSAAGTDVKIYSNATCSGEPAAHGTAAELASPGIALTVPVAPGSTTGFRATAEVDGVVSACSRPLVYTQQQEPAPPGVGGGEGGGSETGGGSAGGAGSEGTGGGGAPGGGSPSTPGAGNSPGSGSQGAKEAAGGGGGSGNGGHGSFAYLAPVPRITFGPGGKTRLRRPVFRFADTTGQPGTQFSCRVDKKHWKKCGSPDKLPELTLGRHVFRVKAVNAIGTAALRPLRRTFKVVAR